MHYPTSHPAVNPYITRDPSDQCFAANFSGSCIYIPAGHPDVDAALKNNERLPSGHPAVDPLYDLLYKVFPMTHSIMCLYSFRPYLPEGHPNCDDLIAAGTPLPPGHPSIDAYLWYDLRGSVASQLVNLYVLMFLTLTVKPRSGRRVCS